jgi:nucleotide-binding universal stress UspA family protein
MAAPVSRKLSNSFEGALAGGGDPATSPLYVFGPFLRLIVVAGVAQITFGASIWLVVFTVAAVSAMYRLVMRWVTDGSGGSGLSEEEFGGWAVKVNAAITFIEYTLTFLVSMAAMVTFIADRFPVLNEAPILGIQYRTYVAIVLSIVTGWLVNRGPKVSARVFGPATAGVLALLWAMIAASLVQRFVPGGSLQGVPLVPTLNLAAFSPEYLFEYTLGGYARILALMTGIEVFANLVAAYQGDEAAKARKAFGSLVIIMGTTSLTMLIVGPAILALSDATNPEVSVFTQTMDSLLPQPLPQLGTVVGILVLLSASAASAQGLQNLALGLKDRHYVPSILGQRNRFDVADWPVWIEVAIVVLCFALFGTNEETYLAIYAAGVFILLSMTGWATAKRLIRFLREQFTGSRLAMLVGVLLAAVLTTGATLIIFAERFTEGAWLYIPLVLGLYVFFTYFRRQLGDPSPLKEELGRREEAMWGLGIPPGEPVYPDRPAMPGLVAQPQLASEEEMLTTPVGTWRGEPAVIKKVVVSLDGSDFAELALPIAQAVCRVTGASLILVSVIPVKGLLRVLPRSRSTGDSMESGQLEKENYLSQIAGRLRSEGIRTDYYVAAGPIAEAINTVLQETDADMLIMSTRGRSGVGRFLMGSVANAVIQLATKPVLLMRPDGLAKDEVPQMDKVVVTLDGSSFSERVLPYAKSLAEAIEGEMILLTVPEIPEPEMYGAMYDAVKELRDKAEANAAHYLQGVASQLRDEGSNVRSVVVGSRPATTIVEVSEKEGADLIMLATHGRGGMDRLVVGSVADRVVHHASCPVFLVPVHERRTPV